jgi:hypothetical protein
MVSIQDMGRFTLQSVVCGLGKENAVLISKSTHGLSWILHFLQSWTIQKNIMMFDWEYLAIKERGALEYIKENQDCIWILLPNKLIEKVWSETDDLISLY